MKKKKDKIKAPKTKHHTGTTDREKVMINFEFKIPKGTQKDWKWNCKTTKWNEEKSRTKGCTEQRAKWLDVFELRNGNGMEVKRTEIENRAEQKRRKGTKTDKRTERTNEPNQPKPTKATRRR